MVKKGRKAAEDVGTLLMGYAAASGRGRVPCGIVYCLSRREAESLAEALRQLTQPNGRRLAVK